MSPQTPPPPDNNTSNHPAGYSLKPVMFGAGIMSALLIGSFWVYIGHPEWLEGSNTDDERIEKLLEANPELSREDLEADVQSGDLSFWLRTNPENFEGVNVRQEQRNNQKEPDPLEVFMKQQREETKNKKNDTSNNPLLNFSSLADLADSSSPTKNEEITTGSLDLDLLSPSTPLDRMLRGEAGDRDGLTPLEAEILSSRQPSARDSNSSQEEVPQGNATESDRLAPNASTNPNYSGDATLNNPYNFSPDATNNPYNTPLGQSVNRQRIQGQTTGRRETIVPANGIGANGTGVVPTTPIVPQNSRRATISPRRTTTANPAFSNTPSLSNDPYSQSQPRSRSPQLNPALQNNSGQTNRVGGRIGAGEINTFSNPYGTGQ